MKQLKGHGKLCLYFGATFSSTSVMSPIQSVLYCFFWKQLLLWFIINLSVHSSAHPSFRPPRLEPEESVRRYRFSVQVHTRSGKRTAVNVAEPDRGRVCWLHGAGALFSADTVSVGHAALKHALQLHNRTLILDTYDTIDDIFDRFDFIQSREYKLQSNFSRRRGDAFGTSSCGPH